MLRGQGSLPQRASVMSTAQLRPLRVLLVDDHEEDFAQKRPDGFGGRRRALYGCRTGKGGRQSVGAWCRCPTFPT